MSAFAKSAPVPTLGETYNMGFERGQILERERIIKLLEEARDRCGCYEVGMLICRHTPTVDETIALIKGEGK